MMRFRLLGPLEVRAGDDWRGIGAPKWRSVLAALLINAGQIVSAETLINEVWGDAPPAKAANLISIYVLRLRRLLGDADSGLLVTRAPGYQLRVAAADTDALLFEALVRDGRRVFGSGDPQGAARQLAEALALWHGRPLADVRATPLVEAEAERLAELHLGALELRITAELACGGHDQAVPEIRRLLADHPLREGLWLQLMQALDGAGRHAEALEVYGQARNAISGQLGVDPGAELRQLYADLLAKDQTGLRGTISAGTVAARPRKAASGKSRASAAPAQLPADVTDFTGRDEQVKRLCDLLTGAGAGAASATGAVRVAVVAGAGGLGKTSLAVHAAHRVRRKFPDGQLYVDLLGAAPPRLPPRPPQFGGRPAVRRPARRAPPPALARRRAGQVPARPRRGRPADPGRRGRAGRPVPDGAGHPPDSRRARQRARRRSGQAATAGHRVVRRAGDDQEPDARPGQHQACRSQRARR